MDTDTKSKMEILRHTDSIDQPRGLILATLKALRGVICISMLFLTAFMMLVYPGFIMAVIIRIFSRHYSRKGTSMVFGAWLALWPFLFEKINKTKVIFSGDCVPAENRVLLISNHRTEVDWMYLWDLALRKRKLGYVKYVLKSSLMRLPVFGWAFHIVEFIPVERRWDVDRSKMHQMLSTFKDARDPLWLALFPEGTDFTEQKSIRSQKFAAENGLPVLKQVLLPKTKGFFACLDELKDSLDAVYDITIGYKPRCPSFLDNVLGIAPSKVHIHLRRIPINEIPTTSKPKINAWLMDTFSHKDKLLSDFDLQGNFPGQETERGLSMIKCLINFVCVISLTGIATFFTFFSTSCFKIYVSLVCLYLSSATYFHFQPNPLLAY